MLTVYDSIEGVLVKREGVPAITPASVWIDLFNPTRDEDLMVERALTISVPTREEMSEIEASSRLYQEGGAHVMTALLLSQPPRDIDPPAATPVTFILAAHRLVTVRYSEPRAFTLYLARVQKKDAACMTGTAVLVGLLEAIVDRAADRVERVQAEVDQLSQTIFGGKGGDRTRTRRFDANIRNIGREGELTSRSRERSLLTLGSSGSPTSPT